MIGIRDEVDLGFDRLIDRVLGDVATQRGERERGEGERARDTGGGVHEATPEATPARYATASSWEAGSDAG